MTYKKIIAGSIILLILPTMILAAFRPATLTDGIHRVAVYTESQAKALFSRGYYLETKNGTPNVPDVQVGSLTGPDIESRYLSVNGDRVYHIVQNFKDATTTPISFANPAGITTTSTVEMARFEITGAATSTFTVACGASATAYAAPSYSIISSDSVSTSSTGVIENNISSTYNNGTGGGSVAKIMLTPGKPYFVCTITTAYSEAFTNAANTFAGKATVRISKTR